MDKQNTLIQNSITEAANSAVTVMFEIEEETNNLITIISSFPDKIENDNDYDKAKAYFTDRGCTLNKKIKAADDKRKLITSKLNEVQNKFIKPLNKVKEAAQLKIKEIQRYGRKKEEERLEKERLIQEKLEKDNEQSRINMQVDLIIDTLSSQRLSTYKKHLYDHIDTDIEGYNKLCALVPSLEIMHYNKKAIEVITGLKHFTNDDIKKIISSKLKNIESIKQDYKNESVVILEAFKKDYKAAQENKEAAEKLKSKIEAEQAEAAKREAEAEAEKQNQIKIKQQENKVFAQYDIQLQGKADKKKFFAYIPLLNKLNLTKEETMILMNTVLEVFSYATLFHGNHTWMLGKSKDGSLKIDESKSQKTPVNNISSATVDNALKIIAKNYDEKEPIKIDGVVFDYVAI